MGHNRLQLLETNLDWDDLALADETRAQLALVERWLRHGGTLLDDWGMRGKLTPGYRVLFHGPSGTGKTLTANLLGKRAGRDVYRVNARGITGRYIGETEKNLSKTLSRAKGQNWILFFDEADALFGQRTDVRDLHDRYANQEVSYLLQRLEGHDGLVILSSNHKASIDSSCLRRLQGEVHFPQPNRERRLGLWQRAFPKQASLDADIDLEAVADQFEIDRAGILNVVQDCCLQALDRGSNLIRAVDLKASIRRELGKKDSG